MKRKFIVLSALLASALYAGYTEDLEAYLADKSFPLNGKFYYYDFNRDGIADPNDWIYIDRGGASYRLLATTPTASNAFGFAPISLPSDLNVANPTGFFVYIDFPQDSDKRFSWVYITNQTYHVYKLMGSTPQNTFLYLDIEGNGTPDPLPFITPSIQNESVRFAYTQLPGGTIGSSNSSYSSTSSSSEYSSSSSYSSYSSDDDYSSSYSSDDDDYYSSYSTSSYSSYSSYDDDYYSSSYSSYSSYDDYYSSSYSSYSSSSYSSYSSVSNITTKNGYTLLAWNDLGMHCMDGDYSVFSILPPYNTLVAHLVQKGDEPKKITDGVTITYESYPSLDGKLNTISHTKTNFWTYASELYKVTLAPDIGLKGEPTPSLTPAPMKYDPTHKWWTAEGIPITPFDDDGTYNPYPMVKVTAKDSAGNVLAETITVLPVSTEMDCRACHASNSGYDDAKPSKGWVNLTDMEKDYRFNILRLHDQKHPAAVAENYDALVAKGFTYLQDGLEATAAAGTPILCASCHKSNALPGTGVAGISPLTQAIHSRHAGVKDPQTGQILNDIQNTTACYMCHPGQKTQCLRGAMGKEGISCQDCHGTMSAVGSKTREGWLDEPNCQSCHQNGQRYEVAVTNKLTGTLREAIDNRFATTPNVPMAGKSLYRYSKGHGDLTCSACHGSTHAIYPSSHLEDNLQSITIQGHEGTIAECTSCHSTMPRTAYEGPHGLHSIDAWWVDEHGDYAEKNLASCAACHGKEYLGSDLSKTFSARTFYTEYGTKNFTAGHKVSCYDCHNGPYED